METRQAANHRFSKFAVGVLVYNLVVILWGAFVRHSGSGAGCGGHWPLCNGEVIPHDAGTKAAIEFTHRVTSGIALILVLAMCIWAFRCFHRGHLARVTSTLAVFFTLVSAGIGALLVLLGWVESNSSIGRALTLTVHIVNLFLLLASITLTAWYGAGGRHPTLRGQGILGWAFAIGILGALLSAMSGAVTSLGDTVFPPGSTYEAISSGLSPTAHFLIRLRLWHPFIAVLAGSFLLAMSALVADLRPDPLVRRWLAGLAALVAFQLVLGFANVVLKAPMWMALVHLLIADLLWIALIMTAVSGLSSEARMVRRSEAPVKP